jgi:hypothetical protein
MKFQLSVYGLLFFSVLSMNAYSLTIKDTDIAWRLATKEQQKKVVGDFLKVYELESSVQQDEVVTCIDKIMPKGGQKNSLIEHYIALCFMQLETHYDIKHGVITK